MASLCARDQKRSDIASALYVSPFPSRHDQISDNSFSPQTGSAGSKIAHVEGIVRSASLCRGFARAVSFVWCRVREHDADWQLGKTFAASMDASRKGPGTVATAKTTVVRLENASKDEYWTLIIASTMWQGFVVKRAAARRSIRISAASSTRNALSKTANYGDIGTRTDYGIIARSVMHLSVLVWNLERLT